MKKFLVVLMLVLLVASVVILAGCGGSNDGGDESETEVIVPTGGDADGGEGVADLSVAGTYESDEGKFIRLDADGTFETDDWEDMTEGTYSFYEENGAFWVDLTFEGGTLVVLSVIISMDEAAALVDDFTLVQYTKK